MNTKNIYGIKDRFHPIINGNNNPEVRSDNPAFNDLNDFFSWCKQHCAEESEIYLLSNSN